VWRQHFVELLSRIRRTGFGDDVHARRDNCRREHNREPASLEEPKSIFETVALERVLAGVGGPTTAEQ